MSQPNPSSSASTSAQPSLPTPSLSQPVPAQPPSRSEIERKLSFRSNTSASTRINESPKKKKSIHQPPPHAGSGTYHGYSATSGNESDSSSITSSSQQPPLIGSPNPTSPLLTPATTSVGGLSAIAERKFGNDIIDEMDLEDVEEEAEENDGDGDGDGGESGSEVEEAGLEGLERGMEGERVVKSGYLWKKQERRKAWKKRWFVLRTGKLAYYKDEKEYSLKKVIDLHDVHTVAPVTVKKHPHSFGIVTPKRTFFAKGSSQDDMEEWVRAINGVRRKLSEREEEERMRREKGEHHQHPQSQQQYRSSSIPIPSRERSTSEVFDTTSPGTSAAGSYFVNRPTQTIGSGSLSTPQNTHTSGGISPSLASGGIIPPSSPMDTTNSLTSQMARMNIPTPRTPSAQSNPSQFQPMGGARHPSVGTSVQSSRSVSGPSTTSKREPSTSSIGSSAQSPPPIPNPNERPITLNLQNQNSAMGSNQFIASSEDEDDIDLAESNQQYQNQYDVQNNLPFTPMDPNKVILSAYLMKRSKGRGRKVWRKRWFVLTSQGVTYTKSHMDTKALRFIPLTSILDALEVDASDQSSESENEQSPSSHSQSHLHNPFHPHAHSHGHLHSQPHSQQAQYAQNTSTASASTSPTTKQNFSIAMRGRLSSNDTSTMNSFNTPKKQNSQHGNNNNAVSTGGEKHGEENTFRLITAKRTYVLCAPSEEDEIKWLAATRALLNQLRVNNNQSNQGGLQPASANPNNQGQSQVPTITQQPPTPAASLAESQSQSNLAQGGSGVQRSISRSVSQSGTSNSPSTITLEKELPPPILQRQSSQSQSHSRTSTPPTPSSMTRGRSATYMAKSAVADVVKKFHPES